MIKAFLIAVGILLIAIVLLAVKILFTKKGKFPSLHINENVALRKKGITCAHSQDKLEQKKK
ncbi:MAG: hypothetical protein KA995_03690 [Paludibacteraceae bacterium]|jgi:hypothetical protein|nr:hypothetical protein [Paludibacteraceae bacterium]NLK93440.1 hypothetical protein [Bacteroidales bacterium]MBP6436734.1 hypothetical protein [Paludibacteraceae bacterium]MBP7219510.1 hypothetical protein [Paludibacteraceae bacterium]MBP8628095.1 hypothetical protein [Paludibacteraceae bacterium]